MSAGAAAAPGWRVESRAGSADALHTLDWPEPLVPTAWLMDVEGVALVLGSTQAMAAVDTDRLAAAGIELAQRRSGGGAVLVGPGDSVWIDLFVPAGDPRWEDDLSASFTWVGEAWARALSEVGLAAQVHRGALVRGEQSASVCFAGLGPGEVTVGGVKVVGLSQRRTRAGARIQCVCYRRWDPAPLAALAGVDVTTLPPVVEVPAAEAELRTLLLAHLR
jgi:lipoate-protein ligase A